MTRSIPTAYLIGLAATFAALELLLGVLSLPQSSRPGASILAMVVYAVTMVGVLLRYPGGLPRPLALWVVAATVAITLLVQSGLTVTAWPGYAAWHPAALQCLLIVVALRGRRPAALVGCALFAGCTIWWSTHTIGGVAYGFVLTLAPVLFVLVAVGLAGFLARTDRRTAEQTGRALTLMDGAVAAEALQAEARAWLAEAGTIVGPSLRLAADPGAVLTDAGRARMRIAEASLRDRIRGGALASPGILEAATWARARGMDVRLLDDRHEAWPEGAVESLTQVVADLLATLSPGVLTVRARPAASTPPAVTIAHVPADAEADPYYLELPDPPSAGGGPAHPSSR